MAYMTYCTNTSPYIQQYYGESLDDLALMPTTTKVGQGKYNIYGLTSEGSRAKILTNEGLKIYMLRSTGWVEVTNSIGSSSGSGANTGNLATDDDINELFNGGSPTGGTNSSSNSGTATDGDINSLFGN